MDENVHSFIDALHALEQDDSTDGGPTLDALVSLFADDARLTNSALNLVSEEKTGHDAIRAFWLDYKQSLGKGFSEFHQTTQNDKAAGLFWKTTGGLTYDGATLLVYGDSGKITNFHGYYDTAILNRELGLKK